MDKPKFIPSSLRERNRYLVYHVISESEIKFTDLYNAMWDSISEILGYANMSKAKVWIMKDTYDEEKRIGIIKCTHMFVEHVRSGVTMLQRIGDSRVIVNVIGVSGTLNSARNKFITRDIMKFFNQ